MKSYKFKIFAILMAATLCVSALTACTSSKSADNNEPANTESSTDNTGNTNDSNMDTDTTDSDMGGGESKIGKNVGTFTTQDIHGESYTEDIFKDYDLTLVNVFATWCTPCVEEMPYLEELSNSMKDKNVQVVGVLLDVLDENGNIDEEMLERAKLLEEQSGVSYPLLLPDSSYMNGMLMNIEAVPYTFFVDKDGNVLGDGYGSNDLEGWTSVVEDYLNMVKGQ